MTVPSLGPQLDGARAKLRRANQQIRALKKSMQRFGSRDLYDNHAKTYNPGIAYLPTRTVKVPARKRITPMGLHYIEPARHRQFFKTVALTMSLVPKADFSAQYLRWGILIGEIVHSIGSSLDNLIWELAQPLPSAPPPANGQQ